MIKILEIVKALADETWFKILEFLLYGERCVCEIFPNANRTQSTVSIQLGKLERWGILESRKEGRNVLYKIVDYRICNIFKALGYAEDKVSKETCCVGIER